MEKNKYILVPCTSRKSELEGHPSMLSELSFHQQLYEIRKYLIDKYIDSDYTFYCDGANNQVRHLIGTRELNWKSCLPAYKRYTGILFSQVELSNWQKANNVLIVSPLWGLIRPNDKIPNYSLMMTDRISFKNEHSSIVIWNLWRPALGKILEDLNKGQSNPYTLLFHKCSMGFSMRARNSFVRPITERNDNYGYNNGIWLNQFLINN